MEIQEPNSGRTGFPTFLKRSPLPKAPPAAAGGAALPGQARLTPDGCYAPADLRIGATVAILGRNFLIYDCDPATRQWYSVRQGEGGGRGSHKQGRGPWKAPAPNRPTWQPTTGDNREQGRQAVVGMSTSFTAGRRQAARPRLTRAAPLPPPPSPRRSAWASRQSSWHLLTSASPRRSAPHPRCRRTPASAPPRTACRTA